jgi:uncharacterized membrane protein
MNGLATTLLADSWPFHHNLGTGGWIAMVLGMIVFWGVVVALIVVLGRGSLASRSDTPEETHEGTRPWTPLLTHANRAQIKLPDSP